MNFNEKSNTFNFDTLPIAVIILDSEYTIEYTNNKFNQLERSGELLKRLLNKNSIISNIIKNKTTIPENAFIEQVEDIYFKVIIKTEILNNKLKYMITLDEITDIIRENNFLFSTIQKMDKQLLKSKAVLKNTLFYEKQKTEFFANISHELRTPINIIFSSLQLLNMYIAKGVTENTISKIKTYECSMKQNCYRLLRLINNLIDITKIDSGYSSLHLSKCNIVDVIENITMSIIQYAESNSIKLQFDTEIEEKFMYCDIDKLERIMLNLLSNAIKFTNSGDSIFVNIYDKGDSIEVSVKDTGIGIPDDKLNVIFERFKQVNKDLQREKEGSGIGLSLVKSLIELHGGNIKVDSKLGEGSTFTFYIPDKSNKSTLPIMNHTNNIQNNKSEKINMEFSDIYFD